MKATLSPEPTCRRILFSKKMILELDAGGPGLYCSTKTGNLLLHVRTLDRDAFLFITSISGLVTVSRPTTFSGPTCWYKRDDDWALTITP